MVSSFLTQHAELDAPVVDDRHFRTYWRRRTRLDDLVADKSIGPLEYRAALEYRDLVATVTASAWGGQRTESIDRSTAANTAIIGHASASVRLDAVRAQLGDRARLVYLVVVADIPWSVLGRLYRVDPKTIKRYAIRALRVLASVMFRKAAPL
jgi:hypothetical protein